MLGTWWVLERVFLGIGILEGVLLGIGIVAGVLLGIVHRNKLHL